MAKVHEYTFAVDYGVKASDLLRQGRYDAIHPLLEVDSLKARALSGRVQVCMQLHRFKQDQPMSEVIRYVKCIGYDPADIVELLTFGALHPGLRLNATIIGPGSIIKHRKLPCMPVLYSGSDARELWLEVFGSKWKTSWYIAVTCRIQPSRVVIPRRITVMRPFLMPASLP